MSDSSNSKNCSTVNVESVESLNVIAEQHVKQYLICERETTDKKKPSFVKKFWKKAGNTKVLVKQSSFGSDSSRTTTQSSDAHDITDQVDETIPSPQSISGPTSTVIDECNPMIQDLREQLVLERDKVDGLNHEVHFERSQNAYLVKENEELKQTINHLKSKVQPGTMNSQPTRRLILTEWSKTLPTNSKERLFQVLKSNREIKAFGDNQINHIVKKMKYGRTNKGWRTFKEGNSCTHIYVIVRGRFVFTKTSNIFCARGEPIGIPDATSWAVLGSQEMFYKQMHVWNCDCTEAGNVWYISREDFQLAVEKTMKATRLSEISKFLSNHPRFCRFSKSLRHWVTNCQVLLLAEGDLLVREGDAARNIYVIKQGMMSTMITTIRGRVLGTGDIIAQPIGSNRFSYSYVAYGEETVQCISIPVNEIAPEHYKVITASDLDATSTNIQTHAEAHLQEVEAPDEEKSETSGFVSELSSRKSSTTLRSIVERLHD